MKIAITGHTKGIGAELCKKLEPNNLILGYSRTNGYDISSSDGIDKLIDDAITADVFINNAYADLAQVEIFKKLFNAWKDDSAKTIVNIIRRAKYQGPRSNKYYIFKTELSKVANSALFNGKKCRIININPGYVRTDAIAHIPDDHPCMTVEECANAITWALNAPPGIEIGELSFWRIR